VNAVCSDHECRSHRFAGIEADFDMLVGLGDIDAAPRKMDRIRFQASDRVGENPVQVATMEQDVRSAIASGGGRPEFVPSPGFASAPVTNFLA
jgi:hypothetical protein